MDGIIYATGMGPGSENGMTFEARRVIQEADVVVGYVAYVELLRKFMPDKEYRSTGMKREIERCELCFELAEQGKRVALVCSGDAGVYGMASPIFELAPKFPNVEIVVVPGVTAANSAAARLGAPLNHDYCVVSLSDLLTPWEKIEKRLKAAIFGDFAIAIYNPASRARAGHLERACRVMLDAGADKNRACGFVENVGRLGERAEVCSLEQLGEKKVNMFTTVIIGNSQSYLLGDKIVTKRGYR